MNLLKTVWLASLIILSHALDNSTTSDSSTFEQGAINCSASDEIASDAEKTLTPDGTDEGEGAKDGDEEISTDKSESKPGERATEKGSGDAQEKEKTDSNAARQAPVQTGPFVDLLGDTLLSLEMVDESSAKLHAHLTNDALSGKKVIGLYFSADWCGPCRQFTPDLVNFYKNMNARKGKKNQFEIVWISRCRDFESFGQYFTHMNWLAVQPEEALGPRGEMLSKRYRVKGIPTLVLLDEDGGVITTDARNKIPMDKAGIGFPWRNPLATVYVTIVPKSLRLILKSHLDLLKHKVLNAATSIAGIKAKAT